MRLVQTRLEHHRTNYWQWEHVWFSNQR